MVSKKHFGFLHNLVSEIKVNGSINNPFFDIWQARRLSIKQLKVFVRNYWEWTYRFPSALGRLIFIIDSPEAKTQYLKTLYSEMGYAKPEKIHSMLFENFSNELASKLGYRGLLEISRLKSENLLLPETMSLINWELNTYSNDFAVAAGAQVAIEWQAYTMIRKLYEGARNYMHLWDEQDEFHEAAEFFYSHINEAEKEHKLESFKGALYALELGPYQEKIKYGYEAHLAHIDKFWYGIYQEIEKIKE